MGIQDTWPDPDEKSGDEETSILDCRRICIDFESNRNVYEKRFIEFLDKHAELLGLSAKGDVFKDYLDRVWQDGLPGSGIISNTRPFNNYLLRPPIDGPEATSFAASGKAPCFQLEEYSGGFRVIGFGVTHHVEPQRFERRISGVFDRSWRPIPQSTYPRQRGLLTPDQGMTMEALNALRELPEHREVANKQLKDWMDYLVWKEGLIKKDQVELGYDRWEYKEKEGMAHFFLDGEARGEFIGKGMKAFGASDCSFQDTKQRKDLTGSRGVLLGNATKGRQENAYPYEMQSHRVVIKPNKEFLYELEAASDEDSTVIPSKGILRSDIAGDIFPLNNQRSGIDRLRKGQSFAPRLADYLFDPTMALKPSSEQDLLELPQAERLNLDLNDDQLLAVRKALIAPDIFLVQGPPGTGKTTVIAEICYQVAKGGGRVLVASQTNLAVDNVLARLGNRPEMRPFRIIKENSDNEFKEFLEENIVDRWFKTIRGECHRRWADLEAVDRKLLESRKAIETLSRLAVEWGERESKTTSLQLRRDQIRRDLEIQREVEATQAQAAKHEGDFSKALDEASQWLSHGGSRPSSARLESTDWANALPSQVNQLDVRPQFPGHIAIDDEVGNRFSRVMNRLDTALQTDAILAKMEAATRIILAACRGHHGAGSEDSEREFKTLHEEQRRLSALEDEDEMRLKADRLTQVNRRLRHLRTETWSDACRDFSDALAAEWENTPPQALGEIAGSLNPEASYVTALEELLSWCKSVREWGGEVHNLSMRLATMAIIESGRRREQQNDASKAAEVAYEKAAKLESDMERLGNEVAQAEASARELRAVWVSSWSQLAEILDDGNHEVPWPPMIVSVEERAAAYSVWARLRATDIDRHRRWGGIQIEWLHRISQTSETDREHLKDIYVEHSNVVGITCNEAGSKRYYDNERFGPFDVVIVDEVSKATPPELLMPMLLGTKVILVGDHKQLPPMLRERDSSYLEAIESGELSQEDFDRFRKMVTSSLFDELFAKAPRSLKESLWMQYRMHSQVMEAVNHFYSGHLKAGPDKQTLDGKRGHRLTLITRKPAKFLEPRQHFFWIDSSYDKPHHRYYETQVGTSKTNELEVRTIGRLLYLLDGSLRDQGYASGPTENFTAEVQDGDLTTRAWLTRVLAGAQAGTIDDLFSRGVVWLNGREVKGNDTVKVGDRLRFDPRKPIGIISLYGKQVDLLKRMLEMLERQLAMEKRQTLFDVRVDTVDRFQGMERPIIIVSLVKANHSDRHGEFAKDFRRINVALSRAQELLVIVGAKKTFDKILVELPADMTDQVKRNIPVYKEIARHAVSCGGRRDAMDLPEAPWEKMSDPLAPW